MKRFLINIMIAFGISSGSSSATDANVIKTFHGAVARGDVETVRSMLEFDPKLATSADEYNFQPVHLLDMYFDADILDLLIAAGADVNASNDEGVTILHIVTDPDAVSLLVKRGADTEARDAKGWTPLIMQANNQENGPDVVAALIANGANPNAQGSAGETALSFAYETGDEEFITVLRSGGAIQ